MCSLHYSVFISVSHSTYLGTSQTCFVLLCPQLVEDCYGALSSSGLLYSTGIDISEAEVYIKMFGGEEAEHGKKKEGNIQFLLRIRLSCEIGSSMHRTLQVLLNVIH